MLDFDSILIVDDSRVMLHVLKTVLMAHTPRVLCARSCTEGKSILERERDIKLMLCDVHLGDGDAFEMLDYAAVTAPFTSVVLMTAKFDERDRDRALAEGATAYLSKPISVGDLDRAWRVAVSDRPETRRERLNPQARVCLRDAGVEGQPLLSWKIGNLSTSGAFIQTNGPLPIGEQVEIEIIARDSAIRASATVVRVQEPTWLHPGGVGVRFDTIAEESWAALKDLILELREREVAASDDRCAD